MGNDLFAAWDNALEVLRQAQPGIEAAENAGDLSRGSAARLSNLTLSLQVERDKAHARWPWLTAADVESAIAQHTRGETIPNTELAGELQRRLAVRSAG